MRIPALLSLLLLAPPAHAAGGWTYELMVGAYGGAFDGLGTRQESGGLGIVDARVVPELRTGPWTLQIPVALGHVQRFGTDLSETRAAGGVEVENRVSGRWRLGALANVGYVSKQDWPDQYQRFYLDGTLLPTDRFTHLAWDAGAFAIASPAPHNFVRFTYVFSSTDYVEDPNYDAIDDPAHLTPKDHLMHHLDVSWRRFSDGWNLALDLEYRRKEYGDVLARDAVTGNTGGNPLQIYNQYEPGVEVKLKRIGRRLDLSLRYGYEIQDDVWQGYYSYGGHNPRILADIVITDRVSAEVKLEAWLRQYGPDSKRPSELEDGKQRWDNRAAARGRLRWAFAGGLSAFAEVDYYVRETNYPDYLPGVNPPRTPYTPPAEPPLDEQYRYYDIDFDYANLDVFAGIEYRR